MAHVSVKSHANGAKNPKAHLRREITEQQAIDAPYIAEPIGLYDCCGVSDGSACAIVTTPEIARSLGKEHLVAVKALQLAVSNGTESSHESWDGSYLKTTRIAAKRAYDEAGVRKPAEEISMTEVHDCFSITELVTMEDLQLADEGKAVNSVLGRRIRRRRQAALPDRRRPQVLRPSHWRFRPAHDLRELPATAGPGRRAATAGPETGAEPQSRRLSAPEYLQYLNDRAHLVSRHQPGLR